MRLSVMIRIASSTVCSGPTVHTGEDMISRTGVVAEERGYQGRALIWGVGVPLAALTAYLRIAADRHYLTDVLVGMAVGSGLGIGVPLLLHPRKGTFGAEAISRFRLRLLPTADGAALTGVF